MRTISVRYLEGDLIMTKKRFQIDFTILLPILLFAIIGVTTIYSAESLLIEKNNYALKQIIWYGIGTISTIFVILFGNKRIMKYAWYLYGLFVILLVLLLFFGEPINNARCWFVIDKIGVFQPSEFMKIILILTLARMIDNFQKKHPSPTLLEEFIFLLKVIIVVAIPSILTFLQPDTGVVLIYLLIALIMLFISGIRYRWFALLFAICGIILMTILGLYFFNTDLFIQIFGTSFFLRVDRLLDWSNKSGYQLERGMSAIGAGGLIGIGYNKTPIYFPEPQTDFIFAIFASNFGFFGSILLFILLLYFDVRLIVLALKSKEKTSKYMISGIVAMLIYQQFQNIGMTYGVMPITGITLPFISYGGSSLLSYMIMLGIILNIANENKKKRKYS